MSTLPLASVAEDGLTTTASMKDQAVMRRTSIMEHKKQVMQQFDTPKPGKKKMSLSHWSHFSTVSWRVDAHKDFHEHTSVILQPHADFTEWWNKFRLGAEGWVLPLIIGCLTATCGAFIEEGVELVQGFRFGYCKSGLMVKQKLCEIDWHYWSLDPTAGYEFWGYGTYVVVSVVLAYMSALLVRYVAPHARGSGIPEVKTILGGFSMPEVLEFKTLCTKVLGLMLSVGAGMSLGKEGPLVHVACCWANVLSRFSKRYSENEAKRLELISTAAAAGVSVAFGAPLGGVLFSYEEVSTMFPQKTMIRAFFSAAVAAVVLLKWDPTGTGKLTMFQVSYDAPPEFPEWIIFMILGVVGGMIGALFVHNNIAICAGRGKDSAWRKRVPEPLEVAGIALVTAASSYFLPFARILSSEGIRTFFYECGAEGMPFPESNMMGLCTSEDGVWMPNIGTEVCLHIFAAGVVRYLQMTITFGCGAPAGLFVPSLYTGAALGRIAGNLAFYLFPLIGLGHIHVHPGIYAMVGAAAVLGGVCRVTISLVVIMFELTSGLQLVVPFMFAVMISKWVGDCFTGGIYDCAIALRGYPFLHEPDDVTYHIRACDIMDSELDCFYADEKKTLQEYLNLALASKYGGWPLVKSVEDPTLLGYVHTDRLRSRLRELKDSGDPFMKTTTVLEFTQPEVGKPANKNNLMPFVDTDFIRIVSETPMAQVHNIFRQLGVKFVMVTRFAELKGLITKKSFLHHVEEHVHVKHDPAICDGQNATGGGAGGLSQPFLSAV